ncbi:MAG: 4Fe-4S ferredoxin, partial [Candidatus Lokiarchaeota archaeon]|nr:4Fe-4S ferredoxin [Candidatus Lokiarchaeota archaeon]
IKSCDARSFNILDTFFSAYGYKDIYYFNKRNNTILIGLACNQPLNTCFCTALGGEPHSEEGLDGLLVELENHYLYKPITEKGNKLLSSMKGFKNATPKDIKKMENLANSAHNAIKTNIDITNIDKVLDNEFENNIFEKISKTCLQCGACSFNCPTCHCFDVIDENDRNSGKRIRIWDTCQFPLFTKHGSGHNPRHVDKQRTRQRIFHKFNYYIKNYDLVGCVGCGRCIKVCPAGQDIRSTIKVIIQK